MLFRSVLLSAAGSSSVLFFVGLDELENCRSYYSGGLKGCERQLGVGRKGVEDVDGFIAVLLWRENKQGNAKALETLLAYNAADAVNLEALMVTAYNRNLSGTPFGKEKLDMPKEPHIPFVPDSGVIRKLKRYMPW